MTIEHIGMDHISASFPFPTEPVIETYTTAEGLPAERWYSPPVLVGKKSQRYVAVRRTEKDGSVTPDLWFEVGSSWAHYVSKENWAGSVYGGDGDPYGRSTFKRDYDKSVSTALLNKWYLDLMEFAYAHDPETLAERRDHYDHLKSREAARAKQKRDAQKDHDALYGKIEHGDVVVTQRVYTFADLPSTRMFVMLKSKGGRRKLYPHIWFPETKQAVICRIRKSTMMTFMKVGPAALAAIPNAAQHEKMSYLKIANDVQALKERGHFD